MLAVNIFGHHMKNNSFSFITKCITKDVFMCNDYGSYVLKQEAGTHPIPSLLSLSLSLSLSPSPFFFISSHA
jgi:hypothetical protein